MIILKCNYFRASILNHITDADNMYGLCISDLALLYDAFKQVKGCLHRTDI